MQRKLFDNFNKFINEQEVEPWEVCMFIHSLLVEHKYGYHPTGCLSEDWVLEDGRSVPRGFVDPRL